MKVMNRLSSTDIRTRALRAAAKVALLGAGFGCATDTAPLASTTNTDVPPDAAAPEPVDSGPAVDAGTLMVTDTGVMDAGVLLDAGVMPDAGEMTCDQAEMTTEEYIACCKEIGWDWNRGCEAWGPPAPPAMPLEVA